jgi:ribosomal protein S18 acetylase RimI-like enzyme
MTTAKPRLRPPGLATIELRPVTDENRSACTSIDATGGEPVLADIGQVMDNARLLGIHALAIYGGSEVVGVAMWGVAPLDRSVAHLEALVVDRKQRRRGYGRAGLEALLSIFAVEGCTSCVLACRPDNAAAWGLYRSLGFVKTGASWLGEQRARLELRRTEKSGTKT